MSGAWGWGGWRSRGILPSLFAQTPGIQQNVAAGEAQAQQLFQLQVREQERGRLNYWTFHRSAQTVNDQRGCILIRICGDDTLFFQGEDL